MVVESLVIRGANDIIVVFECDDFNMPTVTCRWLSGIVGGDGESS